MTKHRLLSLGLSFLALAGAFQAGAQERPDSAALIAAQKQAMAALQSMDGVWRGPAWILLPTGEKREFVQTERIGAFLEGSVKVIEGRSHDAEGKVTFNALGIVSYHPGTRAYAIRSYALGQRGDFAFSPTADGYTWEIPVGEVTLRYSAVIKDGVLKEVGDRITPGKEPIRFIEMNLKRVGDTDWPAAGAIGPR